ncbi:MAG: DinB family protein [Gemmatimonadota bacterium]|nr:DinB family protein [Gemmatimonadota bacterium]
MNGMLFLPEFDHEMAGTRRTLERVPEARFDFKPHEKSFTLRELAAHVANIPTWVAVTLATEVLDMDEPFDQPDPRSVADMLALFDEAVASARGALEKASAEDLSVMWSLKAGGHTAFSLPRAAVLRSFVLNHIIHHRAQLTVYLRLLDVPVPALYGPSADEQ